MVKQQEQEIRKRFLSYNEVKKPQIFSVDDCFKQFKLSEKLSAQDGWYCTKCQKHVQATKKIEIYKLGSYLILSLNRFKQ